MVRRVSRKRINLGIVYGLITGLFFSLAAWGMDAIVLFQNNITLPFIRFLPAVLICVPAAMMAGYLTARFEKGWLNLMMWSGLAILFTYLVINIPLKVAPWLTAKIYPDFASLVRFEDLSNISHYWFYGIFAIGLTCILSGILENLLIDQSLASSGTFGALVPFIVCAAIMTGAGFSGDLLMTSHFREPMVTIDTLLNNGAAYYDQEVDKTEARKMRLSIVDPLDDLVLLPHTLTLVSADNYLGMMKVLVDFGGRYALCHIVYSQPTFCEITHLRIQRIEKFAFESDQKKEFDFFNSDIMGLTLFPTHIPSKKN